MKRTRGTKLLAVFLFVFASYIHWSSHPFFISPKLKYGASVPPEAKRWIEEWFKENDLGKPIPFSGYGLTYLLSHPYEAAGSNYDVTLVSDGSVRVIRLNDVVFRIVLRDGKWEEVYIPREMY